MEKNEIKILKLFGPSVMVAKIRTNTLDALNNYIDLVVKDKKKKSILIPFIFGTYIKEVKENKIYVNWERDD